MNEYSAIALDVMNHFINFYVFAEKRTDLSEQN